MKKYARLFMIFGAVFGFTGVALGAFGAHGLKNILSTDMLAVFETGVRYQLIHSCVLFVAAFLLQKTDSMHARNSGFAFIAGILLFSGSLYFLAVSGIRTLGIITPFGGIAFLLGWFFLFLAAFKMNREN